MRRSEYDVITSTAVVIEDENVKDTNNTQKGCCVSVREKLRGYIHHHNFEVGVIVLVLLDTAVVVTEIMLEASKSKSHEVELAEKVLHYISLTILSIFMVEIGIKIFAMGGEFFQHKFEIFDAVIISVSFSLDISISSGGLKDGVEFLILLRLWRITRVINGFVVSVRIKAEETEEKLNNTIKELQNTVENQKNEINRLKLELEKIGTPPHGTESDFLITRDLP